MQPELELAIHDLLLIGESTEIVAHQISKRLLNEQHRFREREAMIHFVVQSGNYQEAYEVFEKWFNEKQKIPWQAFLNLVHSSKVTPDKQEFASYFFQAMDEAGFEDKLSVIQHWEQFDPRFKELSTDIEKKVLLKSQEKEQELFEKLEYFHSNRMIEQEERLLRDLILAYPEKSELKQQLKLLKAKWAHFYVAEKSRELEAAKLNANHIEIVDSKDFAEHLKTVMISAVNRYPNAAYDFSVGLNMIEFYDQALEMLDYTLPQLSVDWFRAELLFKCRRYIECLDELVRLEETYMDDPESSFASTYLRAQALKELGQKQIAIKLLRSITNVRPSYRSAHGLIVEWERER